MKLLIWFNFCLLNTWTFSQEVQTIAIQKEILESDFYPQIEGIFTGEIDILTLASQNGIITRAGWEIQSFKMSFQSGRDFLTVTVNSNVIPEEIIKELVRSSLKEQVYFTEIYAVDQLKVKHLLNSMVLTPMPNDEK
ncbi:MAG: hypothetical protein ACK5B9_09885 [Flavobacteriia bacterium]|jgi:hypothetical protein